MLPTYDQIYVDLHTCDVCRRVLPSHQKKEEEQKINRNIKLPWRSTSGITAGGPIFLVYLPCCRGGAIVNRSFG